MNHRPGTVIDIGGSQQLNDSLRAMLDEKLLTKNRRPLLPSALLSDDNGLRLWSQITVGPEYYATNDEIELLQHYGTEIAQHIAEDSVLIDLGAGDVRKIKPLLDTLEKQSKHVFYYALDLSHRILEDSIEKLASHYSSVQCFGLWGTFDHARAWSQGLTQTKCFLSLGSIFGNDQFDSAVFRLSQWATAMKPQDRMLLGLDACTDKKTMVHSYSPFKDLFIRNGLEHSNRIFGHVWYRPEDWNITSKVDDKPVVQHKFVIRALRDVKCKELDLYFAEGAEIDCYESFKWGPELMHKQFMAAGLKELKIWISPSGRIYDYLLAASSPMETP